MATASVLERFLRRERAIALSAQAFLCGLAWLYLLTGAGLGMTAWEMTRLALYPDRQIGMANMAAPLGHPIWSTTNWLLMIVMWWTMMIAMMIPSAAPTILLFGRVHRHAVTLGRNPGPPTTAFFTAGYLITWLVFSITAALIHYALDYGGMLSARTMALRSHWFAAATLIAAGLYQFSPLKNVCLSHCRAPASFLSRHWRPGSLGAIRLGALHGAYCVGCCWALMTLLFVGGVMNLIWIAVLTLSVMAEKLLPGRLWAGRLGGIALLVWGLGMLVP